jgi:hypothetical protein
MSLRDFFNGSENPVSTTTPGKTGDLPPSWENNPQSEFLRIPFANRVTKHQKSY